jgi:hypothetical protein
MTPTSLNGVFVASTYQNPSEPEFRLLLDQGFPKPPGFDLRELDQTIEVVHLSDFAPELAERSTPDWAVYCFAAEAGFDAIVARDRGQTEQVAEMWVLTRLSGFSLITWRKGTEDPVREWGQLLAYLPEIKKVMRQGKPRVILLPSPTLQRQNLMSPNEPLAILARRAGHSQPEVRKEAEGEIDDWLALEGHAANRFHGLLNANKKDDTV